MEHKDRSSSRGWLSREGRKLFCGWPASFTLAGESHSLRCYPVEIVHDGFSDACALRRALISGMQESYSSVAFGFADADRVPTLHEDRSDLDPDRITQLVTFSAILAHTYASPVAWACSWAW